MVRILIQLRTNALFVGISPIDRARRANVSQTYCGHSHRACGPSVAPDAQGCCRTAAAPYHADTGATVHATPDRVRGPRPQHNAHGGSTYITFVSGDMPHEVALKSPRFDKTKGITFQQHTTQTHNPL